MLVDAARYVMLALRFYAFASCLLPRVRAATWRMTFERAARYDDAFD